MTETPRKGSKNTGNIGNKGDCQTPAACLQEHLLESHKLSWHHGKLTG